MNKLKEIALSILMATLFFGGLALAGSEWETFPWGQFAGTFMLITFLLILKSMERRERNEGKQFGL